MEFLGRQEIETATVDIRKILDSLLTHREVTNR